MIEALVFGFFAYFGTEIGEYTHEKYDQIQECIEIKCYKKEKENESPEGNLIIHGEDQEMSITELGGNNG